MRIYSTLGIVLALGAGACAGSQGEQVRDARMERAEARAEAREEATESNQDTREDLIAQHSDDTRENIDAANRPGEDAQQELIDTAEERATYQSEAKSSLDKIAIRIDEAQQKLQVLGKRAPTAIRGELATTANQYKMLEQDVMELDDTPPAGWETTTERLDARLARLTDRVAELNDSIEDV